MELCPPLLTPFNMLELGISCPLPIQRRQEMLNMASHLNTINLAFWEQRTETGWDQAGPTSMPSFSIQLCCCLTHYARQLPHNWPAGHRLHVCCCLDCVRKGKASRKKPFWYQVKQYMPRDGETVGPTGNTYNIPDAFTTLLYLTLRCLLEKYVVGAII